MNATRTALFASVLAFALPFSMSAQDARAVLASNPPSSDETGHARLSIDMPLAAQPGEDPQAKDDLFAGLDNLSAKAKESNEVNLDKRMLALAGNKHAGGSYGDMANKMDLVVVRNYEFDKPGEYQMSDLDNLRRKLETGGWTHLVKNRSKDEVNDVCVKLDNEGQITEMVVVNADPKELNLVHLKGHLSMNDLKSVGHLPGNMGNDDSGDRPDPKLKHRD